MTLFHTDAAGIHDYVIAPMYGIAPEHRVGLLFALVTLPIAWFASSRLTDTAARAQAALLASTGAAHAGLLVGHDPGLRSLLFAAYATWALWSACRWIRSGDGPRRLALVVSTAIVAYLAAAVGGEADQAGMIIKLLELVLLGLAVSPEHGVTGRLRQSTIVVGAVVLLGLASFVGAFGGDGHSHELGEVPSPGLALPDLEPRRPTGAERTAADHLYEQTVAALERYEDVAVAAAAGYDVSQMAGLAGHADNPAFKDDGRILDPERPETLVYAAGPDGPVLLGAMFQMDEVGRSGPMVGGPLTVWHAHDHVCFGLLPPGLAGLSSPFGACPLGSVTVALTNEMMHVWTIDGAPERFGDLPEEWIREAIGA